MSVLIYIRSKEADWGSARPAPATASAKEICRLRHMRKLEPRVWVMGQGLGTKLRASQRQQAQAEAEASQRVSPHPHLRRAHWQTVYTGPRTDPTPEARWIPPLLIGGKLEKGQSGYIRRSEEKARSDGAFLWAVLVNKGGGAVSKIRTARQARRWEAVNVTSRAMQEGEVSP